MSSKRRRFSGEQKAKIGELIVERDFCLAGPVDERADHRSMVVHDHPAPDR